MFPLVSACRVYSMSKSETSFWIVCPWTFPYAQHLVWLGTLKWTSLTHIVNIFRYHNQCRGHQCLPNCVQVVLCADMVINFEHVYILTEMKSIHHSRLSSPSAPKKLKSAMCISRSTSRRGPKFPIWICLRFRCEDNFWVKKRNQQLQNSSLQIQQSLPPSISHPHPKTENCNVCSKT